MHWNVKISAELFRELKNVIYPLKITALVSLLDIYLHSGGGIDFFNF